MKKRKEKDQEPSADTEPSDSRGDVFMERP